MPVTKFKSHYRQHREQEDIPFFLFLFLCVCGLFVFVGGVITCAAIVSWIVKQAGHLAGWW